MKNTGIFILILVTGFLFSDNLLSQDVEALNNSNRSITYEDAIAFYKKMSEQYDQCKLFEEGKTDIGLPLHLFVLSSDKIFSPEEARKQGKTILLINNGIHPGEPDGIDASVRLVQEYLSGKKRLPGNVVVCIVPVFNIGGSLNNSCCTRANQNGPLNQGFRGNAKNLDLNRDFIKCDSENAKSLIRIMRKWDPDIFVDTHVSNGADYQYTMSLISTQHDKLGGTIGNYLKNKMTPAIFSMMKDKGQVITTYVNTKEYDDTPESGIYGYLETPRYASGYAALFNCLSFVTETHMLKPFPKRVEITIKMLETFVEYTSQNASEILDQRRFASMEAIANMEFPVKWVVDSTSYETIPFNGFEAVYRISKVTGMNQLYYDTLKPYTRPIKFYDHYVPEVIVSRPQYYIFPQAWKEIAEMMTLNGIKVQRLPVDAVLDAETYVIEDYKTSSNPYEGHYLHHSVKVRKEMKKISYRKGDYMVPVNQTSNKYIVETLEPEGHDSFFAWGFCDSMLQQKEWFSAYVFDEVAGQMLKEDENLRKEFEEKKSAEPAFAASAFDQLYFIYRHSKYFEDLKRYPVAKLYSK